MKTLVAVVLGILAVATPATAQVASDPTMVQLRHAVSRLSAGDSAGALVEFQRVYDLSHSPIALAQMGLAESTLQQWAASEGHLRAALATRDNPWIERLRADLTSAYAEVLQHVGIPVETHEAPVVTAAPPAPVVVAVAPEAHASPPPEVHGHTAPLLTGAGAAIFLGAGFAGLAMRESVFARYNARCRGFGDPMPISGCYEASNSRDANGAAALAGVGFVAGGVLAIVTAVLAVQAPRRSGLALRCGDGPGDVGISCGGVL